MRKKDLILMYTVYKYYSIIGEINSGFIGDTHSLAGSRKSANLQPVLLMPHGPEMDR